MSNIHSHGHKSLPLVTNLYQIKPGHFFIAYLFKTYHFPVVYIYVAQVILTYHAVRTKFCVYL
jgi:hypothetical protein